MTTFTTLLTITTNSDAPASEIEKALGTVIDIGLADAQDTVAELVDPEIDNPLAWVASRLNVSFQTPTEQTGTTTISTRSLAKEINALTVACDKVPTAKRCRLWVQAWDAARAAAAAHKNYRHVEVRNHIRIAKAFLTAHKEKHKCH